MLRCIVLHTHIIMVVKQTERIPNVDRCVGCPIHKYGGLVVGFSIYFMGQYRQYAQRKRMGPTPVKSRGRFTRPWLRRGHLYASVLISVCGGAIRILVIACIQLAVHVSCSFRFVLGSIAAIAVLSRRIQNPIPNQCRDAYRNHSCTAYQRSIVAFRASYMPPLRFSSVQLSF